MDLESSRCAQSQVDLSTRNRRNKEEAPTRPVVESKGEGEKIDLLDVKSSGVNLKQ